MAKNLSDEDKKLLILTISNVVHSPMLSSENVYRKVWSLLYEYNVRTESEGVILFLSKTVSDPPYRCRNWQAAREHMHAILAAHEGVAYNTDIHPWENERGREWFGNDGIDCCMGPLGAAQ